MATISVGRTRWHGSSPTLEVEGSIDISRNSSSDTNVIINGTLTLYSVYAGSYGSPNPVPR